MERPVGEHVQESLLIETSDGAPCGEVQAQESEQKLAYESPQLKIYRDLGDLLALDPPIPGLEDTPWREPTVDLSSKPNERKT